MSRHLLRFLVALSLLLPATLLQAAPLQPPGVRSQDWAQTTAAEWATGRATGIAVTDSSGGELRLAPGAMGGVYTSTVMTAAFAFDAIAPHWRATVPEGSILRVELRVRPAGGGWSVWYPFDDAVWIAAREQFYPEAPLLVSGGQQFQYRLTLAAGAAGQSPVVEAMALTVIDASAGPTTAQAQAAAQPGQVTLQDVPQPTIIPRSGWGADESLRYDGGELIWPLEYRDVLKIVVHHTVTANDDSPAEAAAWVRTIYYYHAVTLGWGDIGYNYLVDWHGNVYEGRYGGPGVVGGHVYNYNYGSMGIGTLGTYGNAADSQPPTLQTMAALADLAAWEANRSYIHPLESAPFYDVTTPNLGGHRDYSSTACPGDYLYARLPDLRQDTWQHIVTYTHAYQVGWQSWNRPPSVLLAGETYSPAMRVRNTGWLTWTQAGDPNAVYLGYRWLNSDGQPLAQPPQEDRRTPLTYDLTFGHTYGFNPASMTTPITPGVYTLAWDMVRNGDTWFHDANPASPLLTMTVTLTDTPPVAISGRLLDVRGRPVSGGQVALPNWLTITAAADGSYTLSRLARSVYTLTAAAGGYAALPSAYEVDATGGDVTYSFVLAPAGAVNLLANADFESGLVNWTRGGVSTSLPVAATAAHTGLGAAQLGGSVFSGTVWLSQTVDLASRAISPSLSLLYRTPVAGEGARLEATLNGPSAAVTYTLPLTATFWTHFWVALPAGWQGPVELQLGLTQSGQSPPTTVLLDEVWLGHQGLGPHLVRLPLILKRHAIGH